MSVHIKTSDELKKMRVAGKLAAEVLEMIEPFVVPGVSTEELDRRCYEHIVNIQNAIPANVGYRGFEKTICSSINQVICHGIPDENRILKEGDIVKRTKKISFSFNPFFWFLSYVKLCLDQLVILA